MGVCHFACSIFCLIAGGILATFWLMTKGSDESDTNLTFLIVAVKKGWDLKEKADSCRNGAIIYLVFSVVLLVWGIISKKREDSRLAAINKRKQMARGTSSGTRAGGTVDTPLLGSSEELDYHRNTSKQVSRRGTMNGSTADSNGFQRRKEARQSEDTDATLLASGESEREGGGYKKHW
eukprot:GILI01026137.1.p1 GENE.GILI01026137.1~~GILI01026137.1.p1  ORF type:complete len:179 (-),score=24.86 GILI01026137.1:152-688(-)